VNDDEQMTTNISGSVAYWACLLDALLLSVKTGTGSDHGQTYTLSQLFALQFLVGGLLDRLQPNDLKAVTIAREGWEERNGLTRLLSGNHELLNNLVRNWSHNHG